MCEAGVCTEPSTGGEIFVMGKSGYEDHPNCVIGDRLVPLQYGRGRLTHRGNGALKEEKIINMQAVMIRIKWHGTI